jgi:peroxiredoxin Q/BCP
VKQFARFFAGVCAVAAVAVFMGGSLRAGGAGEVKVGDKAPAFESISDEGKPWKSSDVVGKKLVVLYFYPADFTGGCTKQACGFRDDFKALTDKGVEIVGVSGDSAKTHAAFKKAHMLTFTLLSDEDGAVAAKYGVPFSKKPGKATYDGQTFVRAGTASRWTVVIDTDGKIAARYAVKDAGTDSKQILQMVEKLQKK